MNESNVIKNEIKATPHNFFQQIFRQILDFSKVHFNEIGFVPARIKTHEDKTERCQKDAKKLKTQIVGCQKVAIVHYWLVNMRGGEKMLEALLDIFPNADIFCHVYDEKKVSEKIRSHRIFTTKINKIPFAKKIYQKLLPLMPKALLDLDLKAYDLVISSEAGPTKGIVVRPDAYHLCYCHSPMRYCWDLYHEYFAKSSPIVRFFMKHYIPSLRQWDIMSANLVDRFITNSHYVSDRIRRYYRREATVVFGPVAVEKFMQLERKPKDFYLFFGRLVSYKKADIAIESCVKMHKKIVLAGDGGKDLQKKWAKSQFVKFLGRVSDEELKNLYSQAKALIFPGIEDLGLVPIEANASGCPVIAYKKGGVLDTIEENVTGLFFEEQTVQCLCQAIERFENLPESFWKRKNFSDHVQQFSCEKFIERIKKIVQERKFV